jgi:hypothetical protein
MDDRPETASVLMIGFRSFILNDGTQRKHHNSLRAYSLRPDNKRYANGSAPGRI